MPWYRVETEEVHRVIIETKAASAQEALSKVEEGDWDDATFIVDDETQDRVSLSAEEVEPEPEEGE